MFKDQAATSGTRPQVLGSMSVHPRLLLALAWIAGIGSMYLVLAMFTQGMLGGASPEEIWWDRIYAWWVDFLAAGWLMMAAVYLGRKSRRLINPSGSPSSAKSSWRVVLFPAGHILLTGCLYFADFAAYLVNQTSSEASRSTSYFALSLALVAASAAVFWYAHRLKGIGKAA